MVVEHVQSAFEVAEQDGDGLDALLVGEIAQTLFLDLIKAHAGLALLFGFEIQLFQFVVRNGQEITQFVRHASPQDKFGKAATAQDEN